MDSRIVSTVISVRLVLQITSFNKSNKSLQQGAVEIHVSLSYVPCHIVFSLRYDMMSFVEYIVYSKPFFQYFTMYAASQKKFCPAIYFPYKANNNNNIV